MITPEMLLIPVAVPARPLASRSPSVLTRKDRFCCHTGSPRRVLDITQSCRMQYQVLSMYTDTWYMILLYTMGSAMLLINLQRCTRSWLRKAWC